MFCLDWISLKFELYGSEDFSTHQSLDIEALSCSSHVALFGKESEDEADCIDDFDEALRLFKATNFVVYANEERFAPDNFEEPVQKVSTLKKRMIDETNAHWYDTLVHMHEIQDEISLVQWGQ